MMSVITEETVTKLYDSLAEVTRYYYECQRELLESEESIEEAKADQYHKLMQMTCSGSNLVTMGFDTDTVMRAAYSELYQEKRRARANLYRAEANLRIAELEREKFHILSD